MEETSHPILAAVAFLVTLMFGQPNQESAMTGIPPVTPERPDLITCTPDPPVAGQPVEICFKFSSGDPSPITLSVVFTLKPNGSSSANVQVSESQPCATITVPANADGMLVTDPTGTSAPFGRNW